MKTHIVNAQTKQSEIRNLNSDETTKYNEAIIKSKEIKDAEIVAKADAIAKKASGKQKLLDLGLSEEEVKALIGI